MTTIPALDRNARLLADFDAGQKAALARVVSIVENHRPGFDRVLAALHARIGRARRIGITGPPGAGKSTLTDASRARAIATPGSPSGSSPSIRRRRSPAARCSATAFGWKPSRSIPGVFIRSMATRGSLGGLAAATREVADVLDAFGLDRILIETVGVGQSELDIARTADTSLVVLVPESGDSIQTLKAGLMEIADVFVVNKADRPGADRLRNELELMLGLRHGSTLKNVPAHHGVDLGRAMTKAEQLAMNPGARREAREAEHPTTGRRRCFEPLRRRARASTRSSRRSTGTSAILRRAERSARAAGPGCASASWTSLKMRVRSRLWTRRRHERVARRPAGRRSSPARRIRSPSPTSCWRAA